MRSATEGASETWLEAEGREIVERLGGDWQRKGGMCSCPAHDDHTPSLSVRPGVRRLLFHCFAGCDVTAVIRALIGLRLLGPEPGVGGTGTASSGDQSDDRYRGAAADLWGAGRPIEGSLVEVYLRGRGLVSVVSDLRYHPRTPYGRGALAIFRPAMLAAVRDDAGLVGVHRTFLDKGSGGLADLPLPKRALGRLGRGAVRLMPPRDGMLGWAEGIENALAATALFGIPCWATLGPERFARVNLPIGVKRLILFLDNDPGGRRAELLARTMLADVAVEIEARSPSAPGADWNDVLLGLRAA